MRRLVIAVTAVSLAIGGGLWRVHSSGNPSTIVGTLRVISASADTTAAGPVTAQQAIALITAKLVELEPNVDWTVSSTPAWSVNLVPNMTQVNDVVDGHVLYHRPWPINAWVAEIRQGSTFGFGVVSDAANTPLNCKGTNCDPPGTLLAVQAFVTPPNPGACNPNSRPPC